jgi:hypothetical protein
VSFDVYSIKDLVEELNNATNISASFKRIIEKDLIRKRITNPKEQEKELAIVDLDPLYGMDKDELLTASSKGVISKLDMYIHYNISRLVTEAGMNDEDFLDKDYSEKREAIQELARTQMEEIEPSQTRQRQTPPQPLE